LGGTAEARELADALASARPELVVVTSLAGRTLQPLAPAGQVRFGGFGGATGLVRYLTEETVAALVDATHPFARTIAANAAQAAATTGLPYLKLLRPPWRAVPGDDWREVADLPAAAGLLPPAARVFLAIGRMELQSFSHREDLKPLVRLVDPPSAPLPIKAEVVLGRGPFVLEDELELLRRHRIGWLVCKNSGGDSTEAKLAAARQLGLPVFMVARPPAPGPSVATVAEVLLWLRRVMP
jgi:precorrin-6A/cobalt-precorrin-6A reductase